MSLPSQSTDHSFDTELSLYQSRQCLVEIRKCLEDKKSKSPCEVITVQPSKVADCLPLSSTGEEETVLDSGTEMISEDNVSICHELEPLVAERKAHPRLSKAHKFWHNHVRHKESLRMKAEAFELSGNEDFLSVQASIGHYHEAEKRFHDTDLHVMEDALRRSMKQSSNPKVNFDHDQEAEWLEKDSKDRATAVNVSQCMVFCCSCLEFFNV